MSPTTAGSVDEQPLLHRFVDALARIVHEERPEALSRSITVAELYQDIAPYRRMREMAGMEIHADYEHALIRFLAGEGGFARLDPETAADELGIEAESSDPDLSLYRKFAACDVRLTLARPAASAQTVDEPRPAPPPAPPISELAARAVEEARAAEAERMATERAAAERAAAERAAAQRAAAERSAAAAAEATRIGSIRLEETMRALRPVGPTGRTGVRPAASGAGTAPMAAPRCAFCGQGLPADRDVRFCPHCGVDQSAAPCASCGGEMEAGWRFCIACGAAAES